MPRSSRKGKHSESMQKIFTASNTSESGPNYSRQVNSEPDISEPDISGLVNAEPAPLIENTDYYIEDGKWVFTATYHLKRGYCCNNLCRHCPYPK